MTVDKDQRELLQYVWEKLRSIGEIFADQTRDNPHYFLAVLVQPGSEHFYYWPGDKPIGVMSLTEIVPRSSATFHASFWEEAPFNERLEVARKLIGYALKKYELNRVSIIVPDFHKASIRATVLLGFKFEGALRKAHLYAGRHHDVQIYGLLREEFDKRAAVN